MSNTAQTTQRYRVRLTDIRHNGQWVREGQIIELTDVDVARLTVYLERVEDDGNRNKRTPNKNMKGVTHGA